MSDSWVVEEYTLENGWVRLVQWSTPEGAREWVELLADAEPYGRYRVLYYPPSVVVWEHTPNLD